MLQVWNSEDNKTDFPHQDCLFNDAVFFQHHAQHFPGSSYFFDTEISQGIGLLQISEGRFRAPGRGTYSLLPKFQHVMLERVKGLIIIDLPPMCLERFRMEEVWSQGWSLYAAEPSFLWMPEAGSFSERIDYGNRKRLQKAHKHTFRFLPDASQHWRTLYALLEANRRTKGNSLAMSEQEIEYMTLTFPDKIHWCAVESDDQWIAAALILNPLPEVWQVVYWGHLPGTETLSPVTFLAEGIWNSARASGIHWVDLGTASQNGRPNAGLVRYKLNLGAIPSLKLSISQIIR